MLQLFVLISIISVPVASKCSSKKITSKIELIGQPVDDIIVKWRTVSSSIPVQYKVFYNKTSSNNKCNCDAMKFMYNAFHCNQQYSIRGQMRQCTLKAKEIAKIHVNFRLMETICIVIEGSSNNITWYSFNECRSPENENQNCVSICPVPENVKVSAFTKRSLTVKWDAPRRLDRNALPDVSFVIYWRPKESLEEFKSITVDSLARKFTSQNNKFNIVDLQSFTYYEVKICCFFYQPVCQFYSNPLVVRTLEEEPTQAPIITGYGMYGQKLFIKWKLPDVSTWQGFIVRSEVHIWKNNHNCTAVNNESLIQRNITANETRISGDVYQATISLHDTTLYCGRVRICTVPGCGPWSRAYSTQDSYGNSRNTSHSQDDKVLTTATFGGIAAFLIIVLLITIGCIFARRRNGQSSLSTEVGEVDLSLTSSTEIPNDTNEREDNNDYATITDERVPSTVSQQISSPLLHS